MLPIIKYIKARFPIFPAFLFSLGYAALAIGSSLSDNFWINNLTQGLKTLLSLTFLFFFFLLKQRIIDEFRDEKHDLKNFPSRPLPQGLISKNQLIILGLPVFFLELLLSFILGFYNIYFLILVYTFLMAREFFMPRWLDRHFTIYFLIHEMIFLLFGIYFISVANHFTPPISIKFLQTIFILIATPMNIEIIRKFSPRFDSKGITVADTYSSVWGRKNTLIILAALSFCVSLVLTIIKSNFIFLIFSLLTILSWRICRFKSDKTIRLIGVINFLGVALLSNLIW